MPTVTLDAISLVVGLGGVSAVSALIATLFARRAGDVELRRRERLFDSVLENLPDMVFLKEAKALRFALVNRAGLAILGLTREAILGKNDADLFAPDQAAYFISKDRETLSGAGVVAISEEPIDTASGLRWLRTKKVAVRGENGEPLYLLGISEDITPLREAQADIQRLDGELAAHIHELEAANRRLQDLDTLKSNFVNSVSHELRTPLTAIMGYAEFVEDEARAAGLDRQIAFVAQIIAGARRLERLVDDMLDVARLDAGTFSLRLEESDLVAKAREIATSLLPILNDAQLTLEVEAPETGSVMVLMDRHRIGQVLTNLITNAAKFTPPGGRVRVAVALDGAGVRVDVGDTGRGIPEADFGRLFQRFSQLDAQAGGTGLGLSIVKSLVEAHGGEVGVSSILGTGSTFWFRLPRAIDQK